MFRTSAAICVASAIAASLLALATDTVCLHNDAVHMLTAAKNVAAGNGISSDVVFYDAQHRTGRLPVAVTNWPTGYPLLLAPFVFVGVQPAVAALAVNYFSVLMTVWFVVVILRQRSVSKWIQFSAAVVVLVFFPNWFYARYGEASSCMVLATVISFLALTRAQVDSRNQNRWLLLCGIFAGIAFSFRYAALFYILALGLHLLIEWIRERTKKRFNQLLCATLPPAIAICLILGRNYSLVGSLFDRPKAAQRATVSLLNQIHWATSTLTGITGQTFRQFHLSTILTFTGMISVVVVVAWLAFQKQRSKSSHWFDVDILYPVAAIACLGFCTVVFRFPFVQPRYLFCLAPFVIVALAVRLDAAANLMRRPDVMKIAVALALLFCSEGQFDSAANSVDQTAVQHQEFREALLTSISGGESIADLLERSVTVQHPLLTDRPQFVGLIVNRPAIGVAPRSFGRKELTSENGLQLVEKFDCQLVLLNRMHFDSANPDWASMSLFKDLDGGRIPDWLTLIHKDDRVILCRVNK